MPKVQKMQQTAQRSAILDRAQELESRLGSREGLHIEQSAELFDSLQLAAEREAEVARVIRETGELQLVQQALQAVDNGSYGECHDCGEAISPKRLAALPWAIRCVECQRKFEGSSRADDTWEFAA
jgi:DnaK suppressor protein